MKDGNINGRMRLAEYAQCMGHEEEEGVGQRRREKDKKRSPQDGRTVRRFEDAVRNSPRQNVAVTLRI